MKLLNTYNKQLLFIKNAIIMEKITLFSHRQDKIQHAEIKSNVINNKISNLCKHCRWEETSKLKVNLSPLTYFMKEEKYKRGKNIESYYAPYKEESIQQKSTITTTFGSYFFRTYIND